MIIATGTGRCGTMTFAHLFGAYHEFGSPRLRKLCNLVWDGPEAPFSTEDVAAIATGHIKDIWTEPGVGGDTLEQFANSSHFYLPFVDALYAAHPLVKVVYLIRDPFEYCRSMLPRGLHEKRGWIYYPPVGDPARSKWDNMDPLERCAWIWGYQNRMAHDQLERLPEDTYKVVWTHDIYPRTAEIAAFVGRQPDASMVASQRVVNKAGDEPVRRNKPYTMPPPCEWEEVDREKVLVHAADVAQFPLFRE